MNEPATIPLVIRPIFQREAFEFIQKFHRHHVKPVGSIFQIAVEKGGILQGVAVVGRPVARMLQDGFTAEVTRLCTIGEPNVCSKLYSACWRFSYFTVTNCTFIRSDGTREFVAYYDSRFRKDR